MPSPTVPREQGMCWAAFGTSHFLPDLGDFSLGWCLSWGDLGFGLWFRCPEQIIGVVWLFLGLYLTQLSVLNEKPVVRPAIAEMPTPAWAVPVG